MNDRGEGNACRIGQDRTCLCDDLADLPEVRTAAHVAPREEVLDETRADIVAHLLELLVHFRVVLIVLDELHDERAVREREELCVLGIHTRRRGSACESAFT